MVIWDSSAIARIIGRGRSGSDFEAIAGEMEISVDNARKRWSMHATGEDREARRMTRCAAEIARRPARPCHLGARHPERSGGPFNMNEPAVPRPRREPLTAGNHFSDDPRARADRGSPRTGLPSSVVWAVGGSSLA
jgi:hypothetical protein